MAVETNAHESYLASPSFASAIIDLLNHIVDQNANIDLPQTLVEMYGEFATEWTYEWATVKEYIVRLEEWIVCGTETFLAAICLMRRLEKNGAIPPLNQRSVHRVYLTCLVLAVKFMEDETLSNTDFAKVGCVTVQELNAMEQAACISLGFNCTVTASEFEETRADLELFGKKLKRRPKTGKKSGDFVLLESVFAGLREEVSATPSAKKRPQSVNFLDSVRKSSQFLKEKRPFSANHNSSSAAPTNKITPVVIIVRQDSH